MKLGKIEDFEVWKKAESFCDAVNAILTRPKFVKDCRLHKQVLDASDSILSNMSEGFDQPTDRAFAKFLYVSKGSTSEILTRLTRARWRGYVTPEELVRLREQGQEIGRMITGLIKHLMKTPDRRRGLGVSDDGGDEQEAPPPKRNDLPPASTGNCENDFENGFDCDID
jgi:four helix bundle protein